MAGKIGVLLVQLGSPNSPKTADVRKYLFQFLNDPRVIDLPWLLRKILVNVMIVPFRSPKSAKIYKKLWTPEGSPLIIHSENLMNKLQNILGNDYSVHLAMRYQNPSLESVMEEMKLAHYNKIIIFPLFPHHASATTGSILEKTMKIMRKWYVIPEVKMISSYYDDEGFIDSIVNQSSNFNIDDFDHILFSYHGLPISQVDKVYEDKKPCADHNCENEINDNNKYCYKAQCYGTTRLVAEKLKIPEEKYTVCFQSRLNKNWLEPFADQVVKNLAGEGAKRLLVFSPAFVADCLETIIEIGEEYQQIFINAGGEKVQLVPSLNDSDKWVNAVKSLITS